MKWMITIVGGLLLLAAISSGGYRLWANGDGRKMVAAFEQVRTLSREQQFLEDFRLIEHDEQDPFGLLCLHEWMYVAAGTPDGGAVYFRRDGQLRKISSNGAITNTVDLRDIPGYTRYFIEIVEATGERVWLSLRNGLIEVVWEDDSGRIILHPLEEGSTALAVNDELRQVMGHYRGHRYSIKVHNIDSGELISEIQSDFFDIYWDNLFHIVDWWPGVGAVFTDRHKILILSEEGEIRIIDGGEDAFIGADLYIYFTRGKTQLWRSRLDSEPELFFEGTKGIIHYECGPSFAALRRGGSREFLVFEYVVPKSITRRLWDMRWLQVDLLEMQYVDELLERESADKFEYAPGGPYYKWQSLWRDKDILRL